MSSITNKADEVIEELESLVGLLKDKVDQFLQITKIKNQKNMLNDFMPEYINLEDKILHLIKSLPVSGDLPIDHINELISTANTYLKDFQDSRDASFWESYRVWYLQQNKTQRNSTTNVNKLSSNFNLDNTFDQDSKDLMDLTTELKEKSPMYIFGDNKESTCDDTLDLSLTHINKIDEELREIKEIDFAPPKEEKKRGCLDTCLIF